MPEESLVVICPNPKCRKEIEEPILLTIFSASPPKQYEACPHCLVEIEQEIPIEKKEIPEKEDNELLTEEELKTEDKDDYIEANPSAMEKVNDSGPSLLERVKSLIPNTSGSKKDKIEKTKFEAQLHKKHKSEKEPKTQHSTEKEEQKPERIKNKNATSGCPERFGYLANRLKDEPIPQVCLVCPRMVDCMLSPRDN